MPTPEKRVPTAIVVAQAMRMNHQQRALFG
jgi:hypothetical protein